MSGRRGRRTRSPRTWLIAAVAVAVVGGVVVVALSGSSQDPAAACYEHFGAVQVDLTDMQHNLTTSTSINDFDRMTTTYETDINNISASTLSAACQASVYMPYAAVRDSLRPIVVDENLCVAGAGAVGECPPQHSPLADAVGLLQAVGPITYSETP